MSDQFVPRKDSEAVGFILNFSQKLVDTPSVYFVSAAEAAIVLDAAQDFQAAFLALDNPANQNPVMTNLKDEKRAIAEQLVRKYGSLIKPNDGISNADKIAIGVPPPNFNRDPVLCPQTQPKINVVAATFGAHTLKYADSIDDESGKKPFGATELQLWVCIDDEPEPNVANARYYGKFTRNPVAVAFSHADNGKVATYYSRWCGRRGDVGPWSNAVYMGIAA